MNLLKVEVVDPVLLQQMRRTLQAEEKTAAEKLTVRIANGRTQEELAALPDWDHVYIAGAYRAPTPWLIEQNVRRAEAVSLQVWRAGAVAVCPHLLTRFFQHSLPDPVWVGGLISLLRTCHALFVVPGSGESEGTGDEVREAFRLGIPVFTDIGELRTWLAKRRSRPRAR